MSRRFKIPNRNPRKWSEKTRYVPPADLIVETLPSGKLDSYEVPTLTPLPRKPLTVICDCCLSKVDRCWIRRHLGFCIGWLRGGRSRVEYLEGWWSFCVQCWALFNARETNVLTARVCTLNEQLDPERVADVYGALAHVVYGDVITWETGQVLDVRMERSAWSPYE